MKSHLFIVCVFILLDYSCAKPVEENTTTEPGTSIIREYHSNGKIKTEITAVGNLRQGLTRNYNREGRLLSEVKYINNLKEDTAINYYASSGKINSTLVFKHGVKEGDETWFFESGKVYRVSPYVNGEIDGIQKYYYESGQLKAEVHYKGGFPGTGLREFSKEGKLITDYPKIIISREDHLRDANKILLRISLSNDIKEVKFYKGSLLEGKYLHNKILMLATQNGSTQFDYNVPRGATLSQSVVITANYKTPMGNPYIISRSYSLQAFNPN